MKGNLKMALIATTLSVSLVAGLFKNSVAQPPAQPKGVIENTKCCKGGELTGYRNDCSTGTGTCTDHQCLPGETETARDCFLP